MKISYPTMIEGVVLAWGSVYDDERNRRFTCLSRTHLTGVEYESLEVHRRRSLTRHEMGCRSSEPTRTQGIKTASKYTYEPRSHGTLRATL